SLDQRPFLHDPARNKRRRGDKIPPPGVKMRVGRLTARGKRLAPDAPPPNRLLPWRSYIELWQPGKAGIKKKIDRLTSANYRGETPPGVEDMFFCAGGGLIIGYAAGHLPHQRVRPCL